MLKCRMLTITSLDYYIYICNKEFKEWNPFLCNINTETLSHNLLAFNTYIRYELEFS